MRQRYQRYAIYWTSLPRTAIAEFAALWFGGIETFGLAPELAARATKAPAVYGLHATFKAPFRLRDDVELETLQDAVADFCASRRAPPPGRLVLGHLQRYLTLMLQGNETAIDRLAADCVTHFDRFRAPRHEEEKRCWASDDLSPREETFLKEFGYPYVLSAFRFHISLAGPLEKEDLQEVESALEPHLTAFTGQPFQVKELSLLGEPRGGGVFEVISKHSLRAEAALSPERERSSDIRLPPASRPALQRTDHTASSPPAPLSSEPHLTTQQAMD